MRVPFVRYPTHPNSFVAVRSIRGAEIPEMAADEMTVENQWILKPIEFGMAVHFVFGVG